MPRYSQNFLHSPKIRDKIVNLLSLSSEDRLLEIGPGKGFLTKALIKTSSVIAIETDERLLPYLQDLPITLIHADALDFPWATLSFTKIVSNIPYHITKPLLLACAKNRDLFQKGVFMVQKEVAEKLCQEYAKSLFAAIMQATFSITSAFFVSKKHFSPAPKVDSAVIILFPKKESLLSDKSLYLLEKLYQKKRKKIETTLRQEGITLSPLPKLLEHKRPDAVPIEALLRYLNELEIKSKKTAS
ncbi:MAG: 16S rRNA (adenine(1518)-N(6)/adenine(1519)-N(6))-dimethyltransferase RsmA [Chlamydiota bacterium]